MSLPSKVIFNVLSTPMPCFSFNIIISIVHSPNFCQIHSILSVLIYICYFFYCMYFSCFCLLPAMYVGSLARLLALKVEQHFLCFTISHYECLCMTKKKNEINVCDEYEQCVTKRARKRGNSDEQYLVVSQLVVNKTYSFAFKSSKKIPQKKQLDKIFVFITQIISSH